MIYSDITRENAVASPSSVIGNSTRPASRTEGVDGSCITEKWSSEKSQTIAIVGLGSIGAIVAGLLQKAGRHRVIACVKAPLEHLVLESPTGDDEVRLQTLTDPARAQYVDWVILATKEHQTSSASPWLARLCNASTRVVVLQNGIDHVSRVSRFIGDATAVPAVVYLNGERLERNRIRFQHLTNYDLAVPADSNGQAFSKLLERTSLRVQLAADFVTLAWEKLVFNAITNPITALTLQPFEIFKRNDVIELTNSLVEETVAVARADGARLDAGRVAKRLIDILSDHGDLATSMYYDRLARRPLEINANCGAIVAAGERLGISTPLNQVMLTLLSAISDADNTASMLKTLGGPMRSLLEGEN